MFIKNIVLKVDDLKIAGQLYLPGEQNSYPTVCVCHGIPAHPPDPGDRGYPLLAEKICHQGFAVLIFNFRGTGASGGNLDILGWTRDLGAVIDYLCALPEVDKARLALLGFSGWAAVSIYVAAQDRRVSSIVACASPAEFTSFFDEQLGSLTKIMQVIKVSSGGFNANLSTYDNKTKKYKTSGNISFKRTEK